MDEIQANTVIVSRSHDLPQHVIEEILVRLPVKSLVRFKIVCRQWFNLISNPDFPVDVNFQQAISKLMIVYGMYHHGDIADERNYCSFRLEEGGMKARKASTLCLNNFTIAYYPRLVSCNNLLLFQGDPSGTKFYIYDTTTQQQKLLPEVGRGNLFNYRDNLCDMSLIYDASNRKYKVVVFAIDHTAGGLTILLIYDLNPRKWWRRGKWRKSRPPFAQMIPQHSSLAIQGVLYWISRAYNDDPNNPFIQPMEITTENFMETIEPPCKFGHYGPCIYDLLEMNGSLCLVDGATADELNIWLLKDSVQSIWIKQYTISLSSVVNRPYQFRNFDHPGSFLPILIVESYILVKIGGTLHWFHMDTKELTKITVESDTPHCGPTYSCTFSLIS